MIEFNIDATINNGKLSLVNPDDLVNSIALMGDCNVELIIRKKTKRRSFSQNAFYWGVVIPAIQQGIHQLGERLTLNETESWLIDFLKSTDKDFTHLFLKSKFIEAMQVDESTGEIIDKKQSTRLMNKEEFSEYLEKVIQFANQILEINIPETI